jgi:hypothetical protein
MTRYTFSSEFLGIVFTARIGFSKRSWRYMTAILGPWLLCAGQRCITRLAALGDYRRSLSGYYRFLSDGKFRLRVFFECLFRLIVKTFKLTELTLVVDDTLCPKWGKGIFGTGSFFDHAARPRPGYIWGHNWVVLAAVVQMGPVCWVALPFWISMYRSKSSCPAAAFRTRHELTEEALQAVRSWFSGPIELLADGAYNNESILKPCTALQIVLVSRIRSDARLRNPHPPKRRRKRRGRKPTYGPWLLKLSRLARQRSHFFTATVNIYGKKVTLRLREMVVYWPAVGMIVKVVIVRDPNRRHRITYLMTTDLNMIAQAVVEHFARRWSIEQLFSVAKNQMGFDSAEVRKERSVIRHAAICMAIVTWIEVWAYQFCRPKRAATFAQKLAALRAETISDVIFASGPRTKGRRKIANTMAGIFTVATQAS